MMPWIGCSLFEGTLSCSKKGQKTTLFIRKKNKIWKHEHKQQLFHSIKKQIFVCNDNYPLHRKSYLKDIYQKT